MVIELLKLIWPLLVVTGILFVSVFDVGSGLDSPGFWLIPFGAIGGIISAVSKGQPMSQTELKSKDLWLIGIWAAAFFCIGGLYFSWFTDGFDTLIYFVPAIIFTFIGVMLLFARAIHK